MENLFKVEVLSSQKEIIKPVKERWKLGLRPNGSIIGTYRSFSYQQEKIRRNPSASGNVDLIDTGDLRDGLVLNALGKSLFTIFSTDNKAVPIAQKYGLDVYGVTDKEEQNDMNKAAENVYKDILNGLF